MLIKQCPKNRSLEAGDGSALKVPAIQAWGSESDPRNPEKKNSVVVPKPVIPAPEKQRQKDPWGLLVSLPSLIDKLEAQWETLSQNNGGKQ